MKYKKYLIISSIIYLLMLIVIFLTFGNAEKICEFLPIDSTISEIGIFVFSGLYSILSIALVNSILERKGISDESLNGYNFLNFKKIFCEYFLNENSYVRTKKTNYFSMYEEKRESVLIRFILVDSTKI